MEELKLMGDNLTELALGFTHPDFSDTYPEWSTVFNIGETILKIDEDISINGNQHKVVEDIKNKYENKEINKLESIENILNSYKNGDLKDSTPTDEDFLKLICNISYSILNNPENK